MKKFYCVCTTVQDDRISAGFVDEIEAEKKPESTMKSTRDKDVYCDWFDDLAEARRYIDFAHTSLERVTY